MCKTVAYKDLPASLTYPATSTRQQDVRRRQNTTILIMLPILSDRSKIMHPFFHQSSQAGKKAVEPNTETGCIHQQQRVYTVACVFRGANTEKRGIVLTDVAYGTV